VLTHILTHTHTHTHTHHPFTVRGTALTAIAAAAHACGAQLVPVLPLASAAVLSAVESACSRLSTPDALATAARKSEAGTAVAAAGGSGTKVAAATPKKHKSDGGEEEEEGEDSEAVVELAAALSALRALVQQLGPFLSPYLPRLLRALLHPATLARGAPEGM